MNQFSIFTLKALRKIYAKAFSVQSLAKPECIQDANIISNLIYSKLMSDEPCMIARFGSNELATLVNYLGIKGNNHSLLKYIKGEVSEWWWNDWVIEQMHDVAGFFPPTSNNFRKFAELMIQDIPYVDILGSWLANEQYFESNLKNCIRVSRENMNPFFVEKPWTHALEGKNVVVIHPFAKSIKSQYENKDKIFTNNILPTFNLHVLPAVQSHGGMCNEFQNWFQALDYMKRELDKLNYDICLLGCGAYGFPLAAHVKRQRKKAIHLGGSLQLYFGIKGKRWESVGYIGEKYDYSTLFNEYWVRPLDEEKPQKIEKVEGGCYW
jgi:hypothetical protein